MLIPFISNNFYTFFKIFFILFENALNFTVFLSSPRYFLRSSRNILSILTCRKQIRQQKERHVYVIKSKMQRVSLSRRFIALFVAVSLSFILALTFSPIS